MTTEKNITIKTNFNKKLDCDIFIHIQMPLKIIAAAAPYKIQTADKSHEPVTAQIFDSIYQPMGTLSATFIYLSHGMQPEEFRDMLKKANPLINSDTILAVYFYQKIHSQNNNNNIQ